MRVRIWCFENCALLGYCAQNSGNFLLTFQYNQSVPSYPKPGDAADGLSLNIGKKLPLLAV